MTASERAEFLALVSRVGMAERLIESAIGRIAGLEQPQEPPRQAEKAKPGR